MRKLLFAGITGWFAFECGMAFGARIMGKYGLNQLEGDDNKNKREFAEKILDSLPEPDWDDLVDDKEDDDHAAEKSIITAMIVTARKLNEVVESDAIGNELDKLESDIEDWSDDINVKWGLDKMYYIARALNNLYYNRKKVEGHFIPDVDKEDKIDPIKNEDPDIFEMLLEVHEEMANNVANEENKTEATSEGDEGIRAKEILYSMIKNARELNEYVDSKVTDDALDELEADINDGVSVDICIERMDVISSNLNSLCVEKMRNEEIRKLDKKLKEKEEVETIDHDKTFTFNLPDSFSFSTRLEPVEFPDADKIRSVLGLDGSDEIKID